MDRRTAEIYRRHASAWISVRGVNAEGRRRARAFAAALPRGARVADLGCGPGWYAELLRRAGLKVVGLDLTDAMLTEARRRTRGVPLVRADLARLPFAAASLDGAFARNSYFHLPLRELPRALAELQRALRPGAHLLLSVAVFLRENELGEAAPLRGVRSNERFAGRLFVVGGPRAWTDLLQGAGFSRVRALHEPGERTALWLAARRFRGLPDSVRPGLDLLVCGLNPSPLAAETGVPFAGPGNRFWPAAVRAGLVARERDLAHALRRGVGFTDLVKRVTPSANALSRAEYARGAERVARLVKGFAPRAVLFVGLDGVRRALDPKARPGALRGGFAGRPAWVMPSTSGRNAASSLATLVAHLRRATRLTRARRSG